MATLASVPTTRRLQSWISSFEQYTEGFPSPGIFKKWCAIAAISGALERKVWLVASNRPIYPNLYIMLTGGPGTGKTHVLREIKTLWNELSDIHVAPLDITPASLIDTLATSERRFIAPGSATPVEFHSLQVLAPELRVFLTGYDSALISKLNELYDCNQEYSERRRGRDKENAGLEIKNPQLSIIGGITPSDLATVLPEGAWSQGFTSRFIMVFSGERTIVSLFSGPPENHSLAIDLGFDLQRVHMLYGKMTISSEAKAALEAWHIAGGPPIPTIARLEHYLPRRTVHVVKLSMVFSAARGDDRIITLEDYQLALDTLLEAEAYMPDIFKSMTVGGDGQIIDDCYQFIWKTYSSSNPPRPVSKHRIVQFLSQRVPTHKVLDTLKVMEQSGLIEIEAIGALDNHLYRPKAR